MPSRAGMVLFRATVREAMVTALSSRLRSQLNFMKIYTFAGAVPPKTKEKLKPHDFQFLYDGVLMKNLRSRNGLVIIEQ